METKTCRLERQRNRKKRSKKKKKKAKATQLLSRMGYAGYGVSTNNRLRFLRDSMNGPDIGEQLTRKQGTAGEVAQRPST